MSENNEGRGHPIEMFHAHLDICRRCREEQIFNLCPIGRYTLTKATAEVAVEILKGERDGR